MVGLAGFFLLSAALAFPFGFICRIIGSLAFAFYGPGNPQQASLIIFLDFVILPFAALINSPLQAYIYRWMRCRFVALFFLRWSAVSCIIFIIISVISTFIVVYLPAIDGSTYGIPPIPEIIIMGINYGMTYGLFTSTAFIILDREGCLRAVVIIFLMPLVIFWLYIYYTLIAPAFGLNY